MHCTLDIWLDIDVWWVRHIKIQAIQGAGMSVVATPNLFTDLALLLKTIRVCSDFRIWSKHLLPLPATLWLYLTFPFYIYLFPIAIPPSTVAEKDQVFFFFFELIIYIRKLGVLASLSLIPAISLQLAINSVIPYDIISNCRKGLTSCWFPPSHPSDCCFQWLFRFG